MGRVLRKVAGGSNFYDRDRRDNSHKTNWFSIPEVRLINEEGDMVGIVPTKEALQMAKNAGLDLINISPKVVPPVCKICDYGKYKYEQQKKFKNNNKNTTRKLKEIQLSINIGENDLDIKLKKVIEFLSEKNSVQLVMQLKGRDMPRVNTAMETMNAICERLSGYYKHLDKPRLTGKKIIAMLK